MTTTATSAPATDVVRWHEPEGIAPRGTLVVLPGRGETAAVYRRFATRLSADAYRVAVLEPGNRDVTEQVRDLAADPWAVTPLVLVGSDSGALTALATATALAGSVDAVIVAGVPVGTDTPTGDWDAELEIRTGCPTHQKVLRASARGGIGSGIDALDAAALTPALPQVPVLAIHGNTDRISPLDAALAFYRRIPNVTIKTVEDGRHDALNDATHRSVAATVVLFLERLRLDASLEPIVLDVED
ncbi:alpha/beta hydrolase [Rhodococcus rhodochrous]|uniref:alpha/beta hydrolase n=1 Tax=Rhodococcus rhodochrous TaxID=1829 RepID=UPI001E5B2F5A|nr:alpha/beta hydrolase [Rhodococcus rhodochrous]MCD2100234.1 alpha/beta hydrolase [Rhodococcus rhodochrous]MCD2124564.1 alpha/beta hydrolase [Rhodococcus rhodochrous]MCQ4137606.1 lysophospholipase [Rhodococcus rhodochrous]MDJ0021388.1 alpha/beta hydrolase [Rhodococcus rhodochrous]